MRLILLTRSSATARYLKISLPAIALSAVLAVAALFSLSAFMFSGQPDDSHSIAGIEDLRADLLSQQAELESLRSRAQQQLDALAVRMGTLNASAIRLNALGKRLTDMADLQDGEFNFDDEPALGGPLEPASSPAAGQVPDFYSDINSMGRTLYAQEQQLLVLENLMLNRKLQERVHPKGRPVKAGYISSYYGKRKDPLHGKTAWHMGVDFAGKRGGDVVAVAGGVVTYSGKRSGYGYLVEINHGGGYVTRYAHNAENLVAVGDQVQPGQTIALIGSSGRATGPHVHFEVRHNGRPVDPVRYIRQKT